MDQDFYMIIFRVFSFYDYFSYKNFSGVLVVLKLFLYITGAGFMKGLKSGLRLKSETLGSNVVNILLSLWTQTQSISQTGST